VVPEILVENLKQVRSLFDKVDRVTGTILYHIEDRKASRSEERKSSAADRGGTARSARPRLPPVWIKSLQTTRNADGSVEVIVNKVRVVLKPHLGALFLSLAEDTGVSDDEGIGFKTLEQLAARMAEITGGHVLSCETVNKYVYRLRHVLVALAGLTSDVIQTRYRWGRRLAIKRSTLKRGADAGPQAPRWSSQSSNGPAEL
jgi:hypothetical protein